MESRRLLFLVHHGEVAQIGIDWLKPTLSTTWPMFVITDKVKCGNDIATEFMKFVKKQAKDLFGIDLTDLEVVDIYMIVLQIVTVDLDYDNLSNAVISKT